MDESPKNKGLLFIIILLIFLAIAAIGGFIFFRNQEPLTPAEEFDTNTPVQPMTYGTDERGEIKGLPSSLEQDVTFDTRTNAISFDVGFQNKPGSQGLLTVYLDGQVIALVYEQDYQNGPENHVVMFPTKEPGVYRLKIVVEPLNKQVRSEASISNVRFGYSPSADTLP